MDDDPAGHIALEEFEIVLVDRGYGRGAVLEARIQQGGQVVLTVESFGNGRRRQYTRSLAALHKDGSLSDEDFSKIESILFRFGYVASPKKKCEDHFIVVLIPFTTT